MSPELQADIDRWSAAKRAKEEALRTRGKAVGTFEELREQMRKAFEQLPEKVEVPFHLTPKGDRWQKFCGVCDEQFREKTDRAKLPNVPAFDAVAKWDGSFPGICAVGATNTGKTRAAWKALCNLYVNTEPPKAFVWFPVRRLVTELDRYEQISAAEEFFRTNDLFEVLFVDDVDKINWQFESQKAALFSFYDWVYRKRKACITTTNKRREWWAEKMGEAFARRLFEDAHRVVTF